MSSNLPSPYLPWAVQQAATSGTGGVLPIAGQCTNLTFVFERGWGGTDVTPGDPDDLSLEIRWPL